MKETQGIAAFLRGLVVVVVEVVRMGRLAEWVEEGGHTLRSLRLQVKGLDVKHTRFAVLARTLKALPPLRSGKHKDRLGPGDLVQAGSSFKLAVLGRGVRPMGGPGKEVVQGWELRVLVLGLMSHCAAVLSNHERPGLGVML